MLKFHIQLQDSPLGAFAGPSIIDAGGQVAVYPAGTQAKVALLDKNGAALTNPMALTRGSAEFYIANTTANEKVDIFGLTGKGRFFEMWGVKPDAVNEIPVDRTNRNYTFVLPFSIADQLANATEVNSGFVLVVGMVIQPFPYVKVVTVDNGKTIDVGDGEAVPADPAGDANGFISAISLTTAGLVADTGSALLNAVEFIAPANHLTWTLSTGAAAATGYIFLPYRLLDTGAPSP